MAIGMPSLIPLYRVQPDPEARFQRFGANDVQLFGKAMVSTGTGTPPAPALRPRMVDSSTPESSPFAPAKEPRFDKPSAQPPLEATYGGSKGQGGGTSLGGMIDFKA